MDEELVLLAGVGVNKEGRAGAVSGAPRTPASRGPDAGGPGLEKWGRCPRDLYGVSWRRTGKEGRRVRQDGQRRGARQHRSEGAAAVWPQPAGFHPPPLLPKEEGCQGAPSAPSAGVHAQCLSLNPAFLQACVHFADGNPSLQMK